MDLTARASNGLIDPVIGRETEVQRIIQILCRRTKNNAILLGEAGVGKTAIAEGLAILIADNNVPYFLLVGLLLRNDRFYINSIPGVHTHIHIHTQRLIWIYVYLYP